VLAKHTQVLLLEAYEQLEADVGQEVDRALSKQAEELGRLSRRVAFLEAQLQGERQQVAALGEEGAWLEAALADTAAKNAQYESGVYGLPQVRCWCGVGPAAALSGAPNSPRQAASSVSWHERAQPCGTAANAHAAALHPPPCARTHTRTHNRLPWKSGSSRRPWLPARAGSGSWCSRCACVCVCGGCLCASKTATDCCRPLCGCRQLLS
jgi:hypothetical protein